MFLVCPEVVVTKLTFITSGNIEYLFPGETLYQSIKETSLGNKFPSLVRGAGKEVIKTAKKLKKPDFIVTAPSSQAVETAQILAYYFNVKLKIDERLLPLKFDIGSFMDESRFNRLGTQAFNELRYNFIDAFFKNKLLDDNLEIKNRLDSFKRDYKGRNILLVSHAFLIKLLEIYNLIGDKMYKDKKELIRLFGPDGPPMGRLEFIDIR